MTERQSTILKDLIEKHIETGLPIGSKSLARDFELSPATLRIELKNLVDDDYLETINDYAGRVPTQKAWEFYVGHIFGEQPRISHSVSKKIKQLERHFNEEKLEGFLNDTSKNLNILSLIFSEDYVPPLLKIGLDRIFNNFEFKNIWFYRRFVSDLDYLERNITDFLKDFEEELIRERMKIMIGNDNLLCPSGEFSLILAANKNLDFCVSFLGPKRMPYQKEINIIKELVKII